MSSTTGRLRSPLALAGVLLSAAAGVILMGIITAEALYPAALLLDWGPVAELGDGGIERWIAYPAVLWLAVYGGSLMATRESAAETTEASRAVVPAAR